MNFDFGDTVITVTRPLGVKDRLQRKFFIAPSDAAFNSKCEMTYLRFFENYFLMNKNIY